MQLITIDQARAHCKADAADDTALTIYANAAEGIAAQLVNRDLFPDQQTMDTAQAAVPAALEAAYTAYDTDMANACDVTDAAYRATLEGMARNKLDAATCAASRVMNGLIADGDIIGAILLICAHLYANRQSVAVGVGAAAVEVPFTARNILEERRWVGDL